VVLVKVQVIIVVGEVPYGNLDAHIRVKGFDASNVIQWMKEYDFVGLNDILEIKNGFHHYSIELVDKWGINDVQSEISGKDVWDFRADGPLPQTVALGGSKNAKKLSSYVTSHEVNMPGADIAYQFDSRVLYTYNGDGSVATIHHEIYNDQTSRFEEEKVETFTYDNGSGYVSKIAVTLNGKPYQEYKYEYGLKTKITLTSSDGFVTTQITSVNRETNSPNFFVNYSFSNGQSFLYEFDLRFRNIANDKTIKSGELCEQGSYTYDKYINPFKHLGYIDFDLQNWSASNKVTEDVDYIACSFPTLIPLSHSYSYNQDGYPVTKITTYRSGNSNTSPHHSKIDFYYER
jgi:hypothetical protein